MAAALEEAAKALEKGEVPVGAVVADAQGRILGRGHNSSISAADPTAHAEVLALREAAAAVGNYRLPGTTLCVTLEPCAMCAGAMVLARVGRLVYGAADPKAGAAGSLYRIPQDERLNHRLAVSGGVLEERCREMLQGFFDGLRSERKEGAARSRGAEEDLEGEVPKRS